MKPIIVAITGASGIIYAVKLIKWLSENEHPIDFLITKRAKNIFELELGLKPKENQEDWRRFFKAKRGSFHYYEEEDFFSPLASGTAGREKMVIIPCSMGTLGRIASGSSTNLIERSADVILKQGGRLVLVPRETPFNRIHIENMLRLIDAGAVIMPAMPGFYSGAKTLEELVGHFVGQVLNVMGIENDLINEWGAERRR